MPPNLFHDVPGGVKLVHINIGNFTRKIADMKNDDIFQNADIISLNETHLVLYNILKNGIQYSIKNTTNNKNMQN